MILIIAEAADMHARCVAQDLARMGADFCVVDSSRLSDTVRLTFHAGQQRDSSWTSIDGKAIDLQKVKTVWHRRRILPAPPDLHDLNDLNHVRREWKEMLSGVLAGLDAWFVNDPWREEAATKPIQLRQAQRIGLRIPDTLITNDRIAVEAFVERHRQQVVHKALSAPKHRFLATAKWASSDRDALKDMSVAPAIFQELINGSRELRITVIGAQVLAAEFEPRSGILDGRLDMSARYRPHKLPDEVSAMLLSLTRAFGLVYSTIDMKVTDAGEYVFLELNPQGQYLYVEILSGLLLTAAMARLLAEGGESAKI